MKKIGLLLISFVLIFGLSACIQPQESAVEEGVIKIGIVSPFTGDAAAVGQNILTSAQIAIDEINEAGGVNGRMIELIAEDGRCNPKDANTAGSKLINIDGVSAIIGAGCSAETVAIAPLAEAAQVVLFSPVSSAPSITDAGDYIFRSYPSDVFGGKVAAEYIFNELDFKKAAVLSGLSDYGAGLKQSFIKNFEELGGEVAIAEEYVQESRDLRAQLTKINSSEAEAIYFVGYTEGVIAGLRQAKELGVELPIVGSDAFDDSKIHENDFAEGVMYVVPKTDLPNDWKEKMEARGAETTAGSPNAYDNAYILADIMKRVGTDATLIKDELYKVQNYQGVSGTIGIDENGDLATAAYEIKIIKDGKAVVK
jgi:branched-chain amino acid transport system substrate-binding protein